MTTRLDPPQWYGEEHRAIWAETVQQATQTGALFRPDAARILDVYVCAYAAHTQASRLLAQTNVLVTRDGKAIPNPALEVQRKTAAALAEAAKTLRLDRPPMRDTATETPMRGDGRRWCPEHARDECKYPRGRRDLPRPPADPGHRGLPDARGHVR